VRIGITGGIGAGKTVVSRILMSMGYPVFNSDQAAKYIITNNSELQIHIVKLLGAEAFFKGEYNRDFVAKQIFNSSEKREALNNLIHPLVRTEFDSFCEKNKEIAAFNEAAILFETGAYKKFDKTILLSAPEKVRISRVMDRDGSNLNEVQKRINNQWTDEQKRALCDFEIINDDQTSILKQLELVLVKINQEISSKSSK
jgi:dephospho-CoA kinase